MYNPADIKATVIAPNPAKNVPFSLAERNIKKGTISNAVNLKETVVPNAILPMNVIKYKNIII